MIYIERFRRNITCKWINLYQLCTPIQTSILVPYALSVSDNLNVGHRETVSSPSQPTLICIILKYRQISANHFEPMPEKSKKEGWLCKKPPEIPLSIFFFSFRCYPHLHSQIFWICAWPEYHLLRTRNNFLYFFGCNMMYLFDKRLKNKLNNFLKRNCVFMYVFANFLIFKQ